MYELLQWRGANFLHAKLSLPSAITLLALACYFRAWQFAAHFAETPIECVGNWLLSLCARYNLFFLKPKLH